MRTLSLTMLALLAASSYAAAADQTAESEMWLKMGVKLRRAGEHEASLEAFLRAHRADPSGKAMAQIGLARQSLHEWSKSADCLEIALGTHEDWIDKNRTPLAKALADVKTHIGWLVVTGPSGARLWLDETSIGTLPLKEIRLDEGEHVALVSREGLQNWSSTVTVPGGKTVEVVAMLAQAKPKAEPPSAVEPRLDVSSLVAHKNQLVSMLGAGLVGGGLCVATVGTVVWIQQARGAYGNFDSGVTGPVLLAGGLAGAIAGSVLIYLHWGTVGVGMTAYGPTVSGRF